MSFGLPSCGVIPAAIGGIEQRVARITVVRFVTGCEIGNPSLEGCFGGHQHNALLGWLLRMAKGSRAGFAAGVSARRSCQALLSNKNA
jgi:hypothetical protein